MTTSETLAMFKSSGALLDGHFKLTSGRHSNSYFQCAKVLQYPEYLSAICSEIAAQFRDCGITTVISPAIGGIVVGTEVGLLHRLRKENPDKTFVPAYEGAVCPNMKKITPEKVLWALEERKTPVRVEPAVREQALRAIERMLAVPAGGPTGRK